MWQKIAILFFNYQVGRTGIFDCSSLRYSRGKLFSRWKQGWEIRLNLEFQMKMRFNIIGNKKYGLILETLVEWNVVLAHLYIFPTKLRLRAVLKFSTFPRNILYALKKSVPKKLRHQLHRYIFFIHLDRKINGKSGKKRRRNARKKRKVQTNNCFVPRISIRRRLFFEK